MDQPPPEEPRPRFDPPSSRSSGDTRGETFPTSEERSLAMAAHLTALAGFIGPLIVWLVKKDESSFVDDQGKEALNWQISLLLYSIASAILAIVIIGFFLLLALAITNLVCIIMGSIAANDGRAYRYPLNLRLIK